MQILGVKLRYLRGVITMLFLVVEFCEFQQENYIHHGNIMTPTTAK